MNTFWLKMAALAVVVIALVMLLNVFSPSETGPEPEPKTFYDVIESDDERLRAEPKVEQPAEPRTSVRQEKTQSKFNVLSLEEKVQAERLFEMALTHRKMGRLPGMTYKKMVDYCRKIIEKYPDSIYTFKARRMLRDIPEKYRKLDNITDEELGLSN